MQTTALKTLFFAFALGSFAFAQESTPDLARARSTFAGADRDKSSDLSLEEALASGHTVAEFRGFDLDGNGALTQNEFIVGYKERMGAGGTRVAPDLENEARRILAERRAAQADATRRRDDAAQGGPGQRRGDALKEAARTTDPLRVRNQVQEHKAGETGANSDTKQRATDALQNLQRRQSAGAGPAPENASSQAPNAAPGVNAPVERPNVPGQGPNAEVQRPGVPNNPNNPNNIGAAPNAQGPNAGAQRPVTPLPAGNAGGQGQANSGPAVNGQGATARPNAPGAVGPAARRLSPNDRATPEELQRIFRERRQQAASAGADDPRAEAERERIEAARKAGEARRAGAAEGGGSSGATPAPGAPGRGASARGGSTPPRGTPAQSRGGF